MMSLALMLIKPALLS